MAEIGKFYYINDMKTISFHKFGISTNLNIYRLSNCHGDYVSTGRERSTDPFDFTILLYKNAIKSKIQDMSIIEKKRLGLRLT